MSNAPNYEMIVAMTPDGVIGITDESGQQKIPWHLPEDMRIFQEKTANSILIMGRKTFESLPKGPLKGRIHVVITRTPALYMPDYIDNDAVFFTQMDDVDYIVGMLLEVYPDKRVFVCGGSDIYRAYLDQCKTLHLTIVGVYIEDGPNTSRFLLNDLTAERFVEIESSGKLVSTGRYVGERIEYEHRVFHKSTVQ